MSDNGIGFDPEAVARAGDGHAGVGLLSIRETGRGARRQRDGILGARPGHADPGAHPPTDGDRECLTTARPDADPRPPRRRPPHPAGGRACPAGRRAGDRGRRRGRGRRERGRAGRQPQTRCRAHGHGHATPRRTRGDGEDQGAASGDHGAHHEHARQRRVRSAGDQGGGLRLRAQGRGSRATSSARSRRYTEAPRSSTRRSPRSSSRTTYIGSAASSPTTPTTLLTPREQEILKLVAEGHSNHEIAARLFLSKKTVETHRANIMRKLDLHDVTELVKYALRRGIIHLD